MKMRDIVEVTPEQTATVATGAPEFTDSAQSVDALFASVAHAVFTAAGKDTVTGVRLFAFQPDGTTERVALVFVGPEAVELSKLFVSYADELLDAMEKGPDGGRA